MGPALRAEPIGAQWYPKTSVCSRSFAMAKGDHIAVARFFGLYYHHGIDIGDGTVVHLTGEPKRKRGAKVTQSKMVDFLKGGRLRVVDYSWIESTRSSGDETQLRRIETSLQEEGALRTPPTIITIRDLINRINDSEQTVKTAFDHVTITGYDLFLNNCEHFAVYCKTVVKHSDQIESMLYVMRLSVEASRLHPKRWGFL